MTKVKIHRGMFNNTEVEGQVFTMTKGFKVGKNGGYVTVDGTPVVGFPDRNVRILVAHESLFSVLDPSGNPIQVVDAVSEVSDPIAIETDAEVISRLRDRFNILDDMAHAACTGVVRGLIVTGPPGVGKSFGVERILAEAKNISKLAGRSGTEVFSVLKGASTPVALYTMLHEHSSNGSVLVLDDSDSILYDEISLNLLKAALDSGKRRMISWKTSSRSLEKNDIPDSFEFKGSVIFITNLNFEDTRGKIGEHLNAIMSRCHYLDLAMDTLRDKFLRCKQIIDDGMLTPYGFTADENVEILDFVYENKTKLRELSLRMVTKIADLKRLDNDKWKHYAMSTCLRR